MMIQTILGEILLARPTLVEVASSSDGSIAHPLERDPMAKLKPITKTTPWNKVRDRSNIGLPFYVPVDNLLGIFTLWLLVTELLLVHRFEGILSRTNGIFVDELPLHRTPPLIVGLA